MTSFQLDRIHRFAVEDIVDHRDSADESGAGEILALTVRISNGVAYPTYSILDPISGETMDDVLDTDDLVLVENAAD